MSRNNDFFHKCWALAFVKGGMDAVFSGKPLELDMVKNPFKDRWFADPFVLDVTDDEIQLLVEELRYAHPKGRIAKLTIDRKKMLIVKCDILLEGVHHLSFPNIKRQHGKVYVYPECCLDGDLKIYEYHPEDNSLAFCQVICDEGVWDSSMTSLLGGRKLMGGYQNDLFLDIFDWDNEQHRYVHSQSIESPVKNNRLAGGIFEYGGKVYCPTQDCTETYGGGICLKQMEVVDGEVVLHEGRVLRSPSRRYSLGMHTINEYKDVVVVDLRGWKNQSARFIYDLSRIIRPNKRK